MLAKLHKPRAIAWLLSLIGSLVIYCIWANFPELDSQPLQRIGLFAVAGFCMLGLVFFFPNLTEKKAIQLLIAAALILRAALWTAPVSDDVNRYIWEGKIVADGENPYRAIATDSLWNDRRDEFWEQMNHRDKPTAYPPGIMWLVGFTATISPTFSAFKALALVGDLLCLTLLIFLLKQHRAPPRWFGFYALNPVILISFAAEAHFDSWMVAAGLAALLFTKKHPAIAWALLAFAVQFKLIALVLTPLFLNKRSLKSIWVFPLILTLPGLPFLSALPEWLEGVRTFAGGGAFNAPLYSLLAFIGIPPAMTKALCLGTFCVCAIAITVLKWRGRTLVDSALSMLGALLICSPIVHFWYLAWLLPLVALRPSFSWLTLSITISGYFLAWHTQDMHGWWGFGHGIALIIWLPWLMTAIMQNRFFFKKLQAKPLPETDFKLAIVIPVLEFDAKTQTLIDQFRRDAADTTEIIVVESQKYTAKTYKDHTRVGAGLGRGNQIEAGFATSSAPWVLIAHSDALPPKNLYQKLKGAVSADSNTSLFICGQRFDRRKWGTLIVEALNEIRAVFGGVAFGDQAMLIRRTAIDRSGGFPTQPLMEDVEASLRLSGEGRVIYLGHEWVVSAKKWQMKFMQRFTMVFRLVATYQIARLKGLDQAAAVSEKMYAEYYPEHAKQRRHLKQTTL